MLAWLVVRACGVVLGEGILTKTHGAHSITVAGSRIFRTEVLGTVVEVLLTSELILPLHVLLLRHHHLRVVATTRLHGGGSH